MCSVSRPLPLKINQLDKLLLEEYNKSMPIIAENKKAYFNYEIIEKFEAGIELRGFEVKAIRSGRINLTGAYAIIRQKEIWLLNADIPAYQPKNTPADYDPKKSRRLLLTKKEIQGLIGKIQERGLTLLPLKVYTKRGRIKIEIGLGKSRKKYDKRELIKKREWERQASMVSRL